MYAVLQCQAVHQLPNNMKVGARHLLYISASRLYNSVQQVAQSAAQLHTQCITADASNVAYRYCFVYSL